MKPQVKLALAAAALILYVLAAMAAVAAGVASGVDAGSREVIGRVLREQAAFLVVAFGLVAAGLAAGVALLLSSYVTPLRRVATETRLVTTVNPAHRMEETGPPELVTLIAAVNELAAAYQAAGAGVAERVASAAADLAEERNRLAALMSELTVPVLVCNAEGRILLYNTAARDLLGELIGLGRSVFGVVDRNVVAHALDRVGAGAACAGATTTADERLLRLQLTPVRGAGGEAELAGFVLTLEDLTTRAAVGARRDALLRTLTEGSRSALASIRAAAEMLLDVPDMDVTQRRRFAEIIRAEAARLGDRIEQVTSESAAYLTDRSLLEDVLAGDLLDAVAGTVQGVEVAVAHESADTWLRVDGPAVVTAVAGVAGLLHASRDVGSMRLQVTPSDRYAALDLRWPGEPLSHEDLRQWTDRPDIRAVLDRHAAEAWSGRDDGESYLRLLLPRAESPSRVPTTRSRGDVGNRPAYYDFDLFQASPASAHAERPMRQLSYTVLDTETTGLHPREGDEIVSIGAVRVVNGRVLRHETYEQLVDPGRAVPAAAYAVHGISSAMLRGQPSVAEGLRGLARFAEDTVLVGHDVAFDMQFVTLKEPSSGVRFTQPVLDTLLLDEVAHPDHESHSLEALADRLGVSVVGRHTALGDALVTAEVFVRLLPLLERRGLRTLGEVLAAAEATLAAKRSAQLYGKPSPR